DQEFYRQSGGGITISGGDPLVQHEFALQVLGLCRNAGVHTAIETCLFGDWELVQRFIPLTDLFIVDLKIADRAEHERHTGRPNPLILDNYARLARARVDLLTRVPLVPGITATEENLVALAREIRERNSGGRVELINFNPLAVAKYALMGRSTRPFEGMEPLAAAEVARLVALLEAEGLAVVRDHERPAGSGA
ncbi:MAG TPA: radical SAM protein, partial [Spirochaetia bacterium]|nr:radical SAM protein [Spirochaetia bacterium]